MTSVSNITWTRGTTMQQSGIERAIEWRNIGIPSARCGRARADGRPLARAVGNNIAMRTIVITAMVSINIIKPMTLNCSRVNRTASRWTCEMGPVPARVIAVAARNRSIENGPNNVTTRPSRIVMMLQSDAPPAHGLPQHVPHFPKLSTR